MNVLFLCHRFPYPPEGGGKIRALHIVRHLVEQGHRVTLCSPIRSDAEAQGVEHMRSLGVEVLTRRLDDRLKTLDMLLAAPTPRPSSFAFFFSRKLAADVDALLRSRPFDLVFAHCSSMGPYVAGAADVPKIMDFADMDSQKWLDYARYKRFPASLVYALEGRKLERAEKALARRFDCCTTISRAELDTFESYGTATPADWFPNGVDLDYFSPSPSGYDPDLVAFVGRMDYYPNEQAMRWFCAEVWPKVRASRPLRLRIVGANPSRAVRRLGEIDGVEVTGSVPDVRPHVRPAALTVAPLLIARGMQNKVVESMAMGVPVVATSRVVRGLGLDDPFPLTVADSADECARAVLEITGRPERRAELAAASRALAETAFSWPAAMRRLDEIVARRVGAALSRRAAAAG